MPRAVARTIELVSRIAAVAAFGLALKPGQAIAASTTTGTPHLASDDQDMVAGVAVEIDVDSEDEDPPNPE